MYKASIEIGRVHKSMLITFNLILEDETMATNQYARNTEPLYKRFRYKDNDYFKVYPHPFVTIDIADKKEQKKDGWNPGYTVALNQKSLFYMKSKIRRLVRLFHNEQNLFYYNEKGVLTVNHELAKANKVIIPTSQKVILIQPCVVQDDDSPDIVYEGVFFAINRMEYYTYLTYEELEYMLELLSSINMIELSMHLLELAEKHKEIEKPEESIETKPIKIEDEPVLNTPTVYKREEPTIPEI